MQLPKFTLVLGGAASGKSSFAEKLVIQSGLKRSYLATAQAFDDEMREKIKEHQRDRGENWATTEVPIELPKAVLDQPNDNIILVDCLTLWLTNLMLSDADCDTAAQAFFDAIRACACGAIRAKSNATFADAKRQAVARAKAGMMTGAA